MAINSHLTPSHLEHKDYQDFASNWELQELKEKEIMQALKATETPSQREAKLGKEKERKISSSSQKEKWSAKKRTDKPSHLENKNAFKDLSPLERQMLQNRVVTTTLKRLKTLKRVKKSKKE